ATRRITRPGARRLHAAIVEVLRAGIENGGTTLRDYRTVDGGSGANQHHLDCYGRSGLPCNRCGRDLRRSVWDGRSTTWCARCQRRCQRVRYRRRMDDAPLPVDQLFSVTAKTVVVTGGTRGIGHMIAAGFAAYGANVIITSRKPDAFE